MVMQIKIAAFAKAVTSSESENVRFSCLLEKTDSVIMAVIPFTKKIKILHSFTNLGGIKYWLMDKIVDLDDRGAVL